jgi:hypothetical protein
VDPEVPLADSVGALAQLRQSPAITPLAGASRPASIRDSAAPFGLTGSDLEDLRG